MGSQYSRSELPTNQSNIIGVNNNNTNNNANNNKNTNETTEIKTLEPAAYTEQVQGNLNIINQIKDYEKEFNQIYIDMTDTLKIEKLAPCRDISSDIVSCFNQSDGYKYADCGKLMESYVKCVNEAKQMILNEYSDINNNNANNNNDNNQCDCCKTDSCIN